MHGGDTYGYTNIVDLSANLHPLGMPTQMIKALEQGLHQLCAYPDPQCRDLRRAIAQCDGVAMEQIVCGNGAADVIFRLCQALRPKKALLTAPTFGEYGQALASVGCEMEAYQLSPEQNFAVDDGFLQAITPAYSMVFLCTPNNPTGQCVDGDLMVKIADKCKENGCYLVIDECFFALCDQPQPLTHLLENPYVVLLRAFTKSHAMAGLRLGYCLSANQELVTKIVTVAQPWSVSTLAQLAGKVACETPEWVETARQLVAQERPKVMEVLTRHGCQVWQGQANYLLFRKAGDAHVRENLLAHGVMIRSCGNYQGLGADYYRIAIGTPENNQALIQAMEDVYG